MRERLRQRLTDLRSEYEAGRRALAELEAKQGALRDTLLRISGAIQALEELQEAEPAGNGNGNGDGDGLDQEPLRHPAAL